MQEEDVMRIDRTFRQPVTRAHAIALVHPQVLAGGHFIQLRLLRVVRHLHLRPKRTTDPPILLAPHALLGAR